MTAPGPPARHAEAILAHMNADHAGATLELARHFAGAVGDAARMTAVDVRGFDAEVSGPRGASTVRVAFPRPAETPDAVRRVLVEMLATARARGDGVGPAGIEPATRRL